jgi:hypothetical protein
MIRSKLAGKSPMSDNPDEHQDGQRQPPHATRWKKGQTGNPRRIRRKEIETAAEMIDRLLSVGLRISVNGETQQATTLSAIMYALYQKAITGNMHAKRVLLKYDEFAKANLERKPQLVFLDNDYTRAFAKRSGGSYE